MKTRILTFILTILSITIFAQIPSDYIAYYPMNGNLNDSSNNGYNGTAHDIILTNDRFNVDEHAYYFDNNSVASYISTPVGIVTQNNITGNNPRSMSIWAKFEQSEMESSCLFYYGETSTTTNFFALNLFNTDDSVCLTIKASTSTIIYKTNLPINNNWHMFSVVVPQISNVTLDDVKLYCDGVILTDIYYYNNGNQPLNTSDSRIFIGGNTNMPYSSDCFYGSLDEFMVYERDLSDTEIMNIYNTTSFGFIEQPQSQNVCNGYNVTFNVQVPNATSYQWKKNGSNINNATSSSYTITEADESNEGEYTCIVSNGSNSITSNVATLTVETILPNEILGDNTVYEYDIETYSVVLPENHTCTFDVIGGNILSTTDNTVEIQWSSQGTGYVYMTEYTSECEGETNELLVDISPEGINNIETANVNIYPNPVSTILNVNVNTNVTINIYNSVGSLVMNTTNKNIDIRILSNGLYFIKIYNENNLIFNDKFIVKK